MQLISINPTAKAEQLMQHINVDEAADFFKLNHGNLGKSTTAIRDQTFSAQAWAVEREVARGIVRDPHFESLGPNFSFRTYFLKRSSERDDTIGSIVVDLDEIIDCKRSAPGIHTTTLEIKIAEDRISAAGKVHFSYGIDDTSYLLVSRQHNNAIDITDYRLITYNALSALRASIQALQLSTNVTPRDIAGFHETAAFSQADFGI